jgi:hypothetical protein
MRSGDLALLIGAVVVLCAPVLVDLVVHGRIAAVRYFAADTFYYLVVARNWAHLGIFTFDQTEPTNGFHPIWQWLLGLIYRAGGWLSVSDDACLACVFGLSVVLVALAFVGFGLVLLKARGRLPVAFVGAPVGAYALLLIPAWTLCTLAKLPSPYEGPLLLFGTFWSFMNGMESGLAMVAFATLGLLFVEAPPDDGSARRVLALGLCAGALTLARLDCVFIAVGVLAAHAYAVFPTRERRPLRLLPLLGAAFAAPVLAYAWHNWATFGSPVPVSGATKSTFPVPHLLNLRALVGVIVYPLRDTSWLDRVYRSAQIVLPALAAAVYFLLKGRKFARIGSAPLEPRERLELLLLGAGAGVMVLAVYDFFFVVPYGPGHWYFPVSIPYATLVVLDLLPDPDSQRDSTRALALAVLSIGVFCVFQCRSGYHERLARFLTDEAPRIKAHYGKFPPHIVEYDDGIVAYATGFPAVSGFGLTLDAAGHRAFEAGSFLDLAYARGFDRVASVEYLNFARLDLGHVEFHGLSGVRQALELEYETPDRDFGIIRWQPRR